MKGIFYAGDKPHKPSLHLMLHTHSDSETTRNMVAACSYSWGKKMLGMRNLTGGTEVNLEDREKGVL